MRTWQPGERVPDLWPKFMGPLDASPDDPMTGLARQLDVTLAYARDVLVAHPDPTLLSLPVFTSSGGVRLHRAAVDEQRRAAGFDELKQVNTVFERPGPETDYRQMLNLVVVRAGKLDKPARDRMKRAYRLAGFDSPPLPKMVDMAIRLVRLHLDALHEPPPDLSGGSGP